MAVDVEVESKKLDNFLENFDTKLEKACQNILDELAERSLKEIYNNYSKSEYQPGEEMDFAKVGSKNEKTVSMIGPQAWYSEFGTGTRGDMQQHPLKHRFGLKPYNSGDTIRAATKNVAQKEKAQAAGITEGTLYWTYKDSNGEVQYTQGIPAQKQVYDAGQTIQKEMHDIVENYMKGLFT